MGVLEARQQVGKQGALIRQQQAALRKQEHQLGEERQARQHQSDELRAMHGHVEHLQNQVRHHGSAGIYPISVIGLYDQSLYSGTSALGSSASE